LYNLGTTGWLKNRTSTQDVIPQTGFPLIPTRDSARDLLFPAIRWIGIVPSWAILLMIILATSAVCATVILRSRVEFQATSEQFYRMASEIESTRRTNGTLQSETRRLLNDSAAIEFAARERLGMVRPNDVVVPIESISSSNLGTISFVR